MFGKSDGECRFSGYHPLVNLIYFTFVIGIAMFSTNYIFMAAAFVFAWVYSITLKGKAALKFNLLIMGPLIIFMTLINGFFVHNGVTVLFYINDNRITAEAFIFGAVTAIIIVSVIIWFSCFNEIMTSEKLIYLFGKGAPVMGLTVSMIFRFIPLLKDRFSEITMGQKCMGRNFGSGSLFMRARQFMKEISILISWSLEASIETADSMEARGYGLKGRTSFHLFKFERRDVTALIYMVITGGISILGCVLGEMKMYYYPDIVLPRVTTFTVITLFSYCMLMIYPIVADLRGAGECTKLNFEM